MAVYLVRKPGALCRLPKLYLGLLVAIFILPLLQLIPLPFDLWRNLPGHGSYAQGLLDVGGALAGSGRASSLVPSLTEFSWLALLPPIMVFLITASLSKGQIKTVVVVFLGMATFQAILGLMQYGAGPESLLHLSDGPRGAYAMGTYPNRDHLAGFLEMALPLSLAMLTVSIGRPHAMRRHTRNLRQRLVALTSTCLNETAAYAAVSIAILLGLIFTQSRTGNMLGMMVILLSTIAFSTRLGGKNTYGVIGTFFAIALMLAVEVGLAPVLNRFIGEDPMQDSRWLIFSGVTSAIGEFFPLGSGIGTFDQVFPRFQEFSLNGAFINRAHNDYLEWVMEGGIMAAVLILAFLVFYIGRWPKVWRRGEWNTFNFIQVGAGISLFAMILHTFVDFNLHIPANQIYFSFLAALFFYQLDNESNVVLTKSVPENESRMTATEMPILPAKKSFIVQSSNPFSE
jgi:hypothetical protein